MIGRCFKGGCVMGMVDEGDGACGGADLGQ